MKKYQCLCISNFTGEKWQEKFTREELLHLISNAGYREVLGAFDLFLKGIKFGTMSRTIKLVK